MTGPSQLRMFTVGVACFPQFQISLYALVLVAGQNNIYLIDFIANKGLFNIAEGNIDGYFKQVTALSEAT